MPKDINLVNSSENRSNNFLSHHVNGLMTNSLDVLKINEKSKDLEVINNIDLTNYSDQKSKFSNLKNIDNRISNIFNSILKFDILPKKSPLIMGILNVTEDSFFDGGKYNTTDKALKRAYNLLEEGADIIDIGAESTRPGALHINSEDEKKRLLPIIKNLIKNNVLISVDTRNSSTMEAVLNEGVKIINDVSGLNYDTNTLNVLKSFDCLYILMHTQGVPTNMQVNPKYVNAPCEIYQFFKKKLLSIKNSGINLQRIIIDPGIGFGKNDQHNFSILKFLSIFLDLGPPLLIGLSRKSFIGRFLDNEKADRLPCSLILVLDSYLKGANILRVHDVKETKSVIEVYKKINLN